MTVSAFRRPETKVDPLFVNRWSPRAYTGEPIPEDVLRAAFEAARWAPSGNNSQPWRFVYARREGQRFAEFIDFLAPRNQLWAVNASAIVVLVAATTQEADGKVRELKNHLLDAGAAWASFALQLSLTGWGSRAIAGFDKDKARAVLGVPEAFEVVLSVAIGKPAAKDILPAEFQEKEFPNQRRPLAETIFEDRFTV